MTAADPAKFIKGARRSGDQWSGQDFGADRPETGGMDDELGAK